MNDLQPPLDPKYRATARMLATFDLQSWDEATHVVDHTLTGQLTLLNEHARHLGRTIYADRWALLITVAVIWLATIGVVALIMAVGR